MHSMSYHHPTPDALAASVGGADNALASHAREHAQECTVCRAELLDYQRIVDVLKGYIPAHAVDKGDHLTVDELQSYIELAIDDPVRVGFHRHIQACGQCIKLALTLCARASSNGTKFVGKRASSSVSSKTHGVWIMSWGALKGNSVALTACITLLMALSSFSTWIMMRGSMPELLGVPISVYQDDEMMYFTSTSSMEIGGFATSARRATPFEGIKVHETADHRYQVQWEPIPGAVEYELRVYSFAGGEQRVEFSQIALVPRVMVPGRQLRTGGRFEWELRGKTFDDLVFTAKGGFVIQPLAGQG